VAPRVAITAVEARTALGDDLGGTWQQLCAGASAVGPVATFDASGFGAPFAAPIWREAETAEDDPALRILGPHGRLLEALCRTVHERAGAETCPREAMGLFLGLGMVDASVADLAPAALASRDDRGDLSLSAFFDGAYRAVHPLWPLSMLGNVAAGQVAIDLNLRGDNLVTSSDADATLRALLEASRSIREGHCQAALTGGVSGRISPAVLARLALQGRLGQGQPRPLSQDPQGVAAGEGGAIFLLESETAARARDLEPLAYLLGGATAFGRADEHPGPTPAALARAIRAALRAGSREASQVDVVFLHAEGSAGLDAAELEALAQTGLGACPLVASKGALGHLGAGSPAVDLALLLRTLEAGLIPPSVTTPPLLPGAGGIVRDAARAKKVRCGLVLAAGVCGGAGALLVEVA